MTPVAIIVATCRTPGCGNVDAPIRLELLEPVDGVLCGVCLEPIVDVVEA